MDVDAYLRRIGYDGPRQPSLEVLRGLHRSHLYSVPFENLDIALGMPYQSWNPIVCMTRLLRGAVAASATS